MQALDYPNLADAGIFSFCHYRPMDESQFIDAMAAKLGTKKSGKVTQTELARAVGLPSQSAVSNIINRTRALRGDERSKIAAFLGIDEGPQVQWVPVIGLASAGAWNEAVQMPIRQFPMPPRIAGKRAFAVEIRGDSMNLLLPEGGWAVVDPDRTELYAGRVYLIQNADSETTVKRYKNDPARFEPVSDNELHQPIMIANQSIRVVGRIVSYGNDEGL